ncbi:dihydrolipoamide acetyltransferase [Mycobacterium europaeum]|uniref:Dihydrolipoamide acetyltransferase component of pyruvate dehydrogenase complex n=1 Tax=Mycobacterium europaeum TaxID=761804 RepID=A0A0U1D3W3_9MYCO|nr:2-oxo acid dehydrogenase subunit E2 [Mycobacterium europaeum]CQD06648.1 dihydrolipoamide acetyltransferase [Mycobacterium europaeum]
MTTRIYLPSLGEGVQEASVTRWLKRPGDYVEQDEPLLEVATDKVDTEIPAPCSGTITELFADENDVVATGAALAVMTREAPGFPIDGANIIATPDIPPAAPPREKAAPAQSVTEKLSPVRRTIARRMMESLQTSAQLTTVVEVDLGAVSRMRTERKDEFLHRTGVKLSYLPFFAKAALEALPQYRMLNASLNAEATEVTYHGTCHLGIAVEGPKGLMVPVIRGATDLSIMRLACAIAELADKVRTGGITVDELNGGTFTITNTGSRGALFDTPIINQPQTGILGTGAVVERLVPVRGDGNALRIEVRPMAYLSISYDHRIVDGADAAGFLNAVKGRLEAGYTAAELGD